MTGKGLSAKSFVLHVTRTSARGGNQTHIAEMMNRHKGTISKWAAHAVKEGCLYKRGNRLLPPTGTPDPESPFEEDDIEV